VFRHFVQACKGNTARLKLSDGRFCLIFVTKDLYVQRIPELGRLTAVEERRLQASAVRLGSPPELDDFPSVAFRWSACG